MKKTILILTFLFLYGNVSAQCPTEVGVFLQTQQDVNLFAVNYPNCTDYSGNIYLGEVYSDDPSNISNLNGLSQLTSIGGYLDIYDTSLSNLDGLNQLTSIGGNLSITSNGLLTDIEALNQISTIGEDVVIDRNFLLNSLDGLNNLNMIDGHIRISNNFVLNSISALENLAPSSITYLEIVSNGSLAVCNVLSICDYLQGGGTSLIVGNATGCSNSMEILEGCTTMENCPPGDVTLRTQQEVDDFAANYPNCTNIAGELSVYQTPLTTDNITNLDGLNQITTIDGNLDIRQNEYLADISGLNQLTFVGNYITIINNPLLTNLDALSQITSIGGGLYISINHGLLNIDGLSQLTNIDGDVTVRRNYALTNIDGLNQIANIEGDVWIESNLLLTNVDGLSQITSLNGYLKIENNHQLASLEGLSQITTIGEDLAVSNSHVLTHLEGLNQITSVKSIDISANKMLTDLSAISQITSLEGGLKITYNDILTDLNDLSQLDEVGGNLEISNNDILDDLTGLSELTSVGGNLDITYGHSLTSLYGLHQITTVGGRLQISANDLLTDLAELAALTSVGTNVFIGFNDILNNLNGLQSLTTINPNSYAFNGEISINDNLILNDISALENVNPNDIGIVEIYRNPNLSSCSISNFCEHLENGGFETISNTNAAGCNNRQEILDACTALPIEMPTPLQVRLQNHTATLRWRTATETNNSGFEIQRSQDGINWQRIGWQAGQGTTTSPHTYTHADENPLTGTSYYRLRQVDFDGQFNYSNIVSLDYTRPQIDIFPNPVKDKLRILTEGVFIDNVLIFNVTGQQIDIPFNDNSLDVSLLPAGLYTLKIGMDERYFYEKVVVE